MSGVYEKLLTLQLHGLIGVPLTLLSSFGNRDIEPTLNWISLIVLGSKHLVVERSPFLLQLGKLLLLGAVDIGHLGVELEVILKLLHLVHSILLLCLTLVLKVLTRDLPKHSKTLGGDTKEVYSWIDTNNWLGQDCPAFLIDIDIGSD